MYDNLKPYRGPSFRYKIRKVTTNNKTGDSFAITVPRSIAILFQNVEFNVFIAGSNIILGSGCRLSNKQEKTENCQTDFL